MSRRVVILWVSQEQVMAMMHLATRSTHQYLYLPRIKHCTDEQGNEFIIPDDAHTEDVCYSWERRGFGFRMSHPSFAEVKDGECPPVLKHRNLVIEIRNIVEVVPDHVILETPQ